MKEILIAVFIILLFLALSIWQGMKVNKESRHCLIGLWLVIISPFGLAAGFGGWHYGIINRMIGCISIPLFLVGLFLVIKNRKYIRDWIPRF